MKACLICVVSGSVYERYAERLFASAEGKFPGDCRALPGREGWPDATLYRYHVLLEYDWSAYNYLYLCDADMLFAAKVGREILSPLVATAHPGYVHMRKNLPYEKRPQSAAFVHKGTTYYAGGFVGGKREAFLDLARGIKNQIDRDDANGIVARWHDESHLNAQLALLPPTRTLSPSYCYPDDASAYPWLNGTRRILVALDKTPSERGER